MKKTALVALSILCCLVSAGARADDREVAVGLVQKAVAFYKANGPEKLLDEANNAQGPFVSGTTYLFIEDATGTVLAHPMNSRLVGQPMNALKDVDGKLFNKEFQDMAKSAGSGWVDYKFLNPKTGAVERKTSYVERVDDLVLVCGIYLK